ncbi:MAG: MMPL family transporter [Leptospirales bacterium]
MFSKYSIKYPKTIILIILCLNALAVIPLTNIEFNTALSVWSNKDLPTFIKYEKFQQTFGNDISFGIMYQTENIFTKEQLSLNAKLTEKLKLVENIENVLSLTNVESVSLRNYKIVKTKIIKKNARNMEYQKKLALKDTTLVDNFITRDAKSTVIWLQPKIINDEQSRLTLQAVKKLLEEPEFAGIEFHLIGGFPLINELSKITNTESGTFVAICVIIMIILLRLLLHSFSMAILPIIVALNSALLVTGLYTSNHEMNSVSGIMPLIIIIISIANSVHIVLHFKAKSIIGHTTQESILLSMKELAVPCLFTNLTTGIAFLAFITSELPPLQTLGMYTALGTMITYILSFTLLPAIMTTFQKILFKQKHLHKEPRTNSFIINLPIWVSKHKFPIIFISIAILALSIFGARNLEFQTDQIRHLHPSNPVRHSMNLYQEWFEGVYPIDLILEAPEKKYFHKRQNLRKIQNLEKEIIELEYTKKIYSANTFLDSSKRRLSAQAGIKFTPRQEQQGINRLLALNFPMLRKFLPEGGDHYRISINSSWLDNNQTETLALDILNLAESFAKENNLTAYTTGYTTMYTDINQLLIRSQRSSITISFICIFLMIIIMTRRFWLSLLAMIPNILPVITTVGVMGWIGIKLDVATVLIAAISLGIAVDDTIHLIYAFLDHRKEGKDVPEALSIAMRHVGNPILITTVILVGGFSVLTISNFLPVAYLGGFIALNVIFALLYDFLLLPAIISFFHIRNKQKS